MQKVLKTARDADQFAGKIARGTEFCLNATSDELRRIIAKADRKFEWTLGEVPATVAEVERFAASLENADALVPEGAYVCVSRRGRRITVGQMQCF